MKFLIYFILTFFTVTSYCCEIKTYSKIYLSSGFQASDFQDLVNSTNCKSDQILLIGEILKKSEGRISTSLIKRLTGINDLKLIPKKVNIISLEKVVKSRILERESWFAKDIKLLNNAAAIGLESNEILNTECLNCNKTGTANIKLTQKNIDSGLNKTHWASAIIKIKTRALIANKNLNINSKSISPKSFEFKNIYSAKPETYFTNLNQLHFYKLNKPIRKGSPITFNDLTSVPLVNYGQKVKVRYHQKGLILMGFGISTSTGKLGQIIQLRNPNTKKIFTAKIINFNEVEVDL